MAEEQPNVEAEIAALEKTLAEKRATLQKEKDAGATAEMPHDKELIREALREKIAATPSAGTPPPPPTQTSTTTPTAVPPSYLSDELKPKVQELVNIAFEKSLEHAIALAKGAESAALLDAFHDIMVDELYQKLVERGKLTQL